MYPDIYSEARSIWHKLSTTSPTHNLPLEEEVRQRLSKFFLAGDHYYYIFNVPNAEFELVSEEMTLVLGYAPTEMSLVFYITLIHPDDRCWVLNCEQRWSEFIAGLPMDRVPKYKIWYDYRVRRKSGDYIRILQQLLMLQHSEGQPAQRTLGMHTDISHLSQYSQPTLSFVGLDGEPSYLNVSVQEHFTTQPPRFTRREIEVLQLLAAGKSSEEIARAAFISRQTVDTHRKNMLKKTGCTNISELVSMAIRKGWLPPLFIPVFLQLLFQ